MSIYMRKNFLFLPVLMVILYPLIPGGKGAEAARIELRSRLTGVAGEVRIPLDKSGIVDVWLDGEGERIRTLNLYLSYDNQVIRPLDAHPGIEGLNPFLSGSYMPKPDEVFNAALEDRGELFYGVTNSGDLAATGAGIIASFEVEVFAPKFTSDITVDFRFPLNFTSYEILTDQGTLEQGHFERGEATDMHILIGQGLVVSDIPNLELGGGAQDQSILLDDYVADAVYPDDQIEWSVSEQSRVGVGIDENRRVTVVAPKNWSGIAELEFTATSPDELRATDAVQVKVVGAPKLQTGIAGLPDIVMGEDTTHERFDLDDFLVPDALNPPAELSWFTAGQEEIQIQIDKDTHELRLIPAPNWSGEEEVFFTVKNRFGLVDTATISVMVTELNDLPIIAELQETLKVLVGEEAAGPLISDIVGDEDHALDELIISVRGEGGVAAQIREGRLVVQGFQLGSAQVELSAEDPRGGKATALFTVLVEEEKLPPDLSAFVDTTALEGELFILPLDGFVDDPDTADEQLSWEVSTGALLEVEVDGQRNLVMAIPMGFRGVIELSFTVADPAGNSANEKMRVTVLERPVLNVPDLELISGESLVLQLGKYLSGLDPDGLTWSLQGPLPAGLGVLLDSQVGQVEFVAARGLSETIELRLMAQGEEGHALLDTFLVQVELPPPVEYSVAVPDTFVESGSSLSLELGLYVGGIAAGELRWGLEGFLGEGLSATLDTLSGRMSIDTIGDMGGQGSFSILALGPQNQAVRDTFIVQVISVDRSVRIGDIPDLIIVAGQPDTSLVLDQYVVRGERESLSWEVVSPTVLAVAIDPLTRRVLVAAPDNFSGLATLLFTVRDKYGNEKADVVQVAVEQPPPVLALGDIPDLSLVAGEVFEFDLDEFVALGNAAELSWSVVAAFVEVEIDASTRRVRVQAPSEESSGQDILLFTATDGEGNSASDIVQVAVSERLQLRDIPDIDLVHGEVAEIFLDDFVARGPVQLLEWSIQGGSLVLAGHNTVTRKAQIRAPATGVGEEVFIIRAVAPDGQTESDSLRVSYAPPRLLLADIPNFSMRAGLVDTSLVLDDYLVIGAVDSTNWSVGGTQHLVVQIQRDNRQVRIEAPVDFVGAETLVFSATLGTVSAMDTVQIEILEALPVLALGDIPDLVLSAGQSDSSLVLDNYVSIGDPEAVIWRWAGERNLEVFIEPTTRRLHLQSSGVLEDEILVLTAVLGESSVTDTLRISLVVPQPRLELARVGKVELMRGTVDSSLVLSDYLLEGDPSLVEWSVKGGVHVVPSVDPEGGRLLLDGHQALPGRELFELKASQGQVSATTLINVTVKDPLFSLENFPVLRIAAGLEDYSLDLKSYVRGDFAPELIRWEALPSDGLSTYVDSVKHVLHLAPKELFAGTAHVLLRAYNPLQDMSQVTLQVEVVGPPQIGALPPLFLMAGTADQVLDLDEYAQDENPGSLIWRPLQVGDIRMSIDPTTHILSVEIPPDLSGNVLRQLAVRHQDGLVETRVDLSMTIMVPSKGPVLQLPEQIALPAGEGVEIDLDGLVEDQDTEDALISWRIDPLGGDLSVRIDSLARRLLVEAPGILSLVETISLRATDPEGNSAAGLVQVRVVNLDATAPYLQLQIRGNKIFAEFLSFAIYSDEILSESPLMQLNGQQLDVEDRGDHYVAGYTVIEEGTVQIAVSGTDRAGNTGTVLLEVSLRKLAGVGGTVSSPDQGVKMNVSALGGGGHLGLVYATRVGASGQRGYHLELLGGIPGESKVDIVFAYDFDANLLDDPVIQRWDENLSEWEDLNTYAKVEQGLLFTTAAKLGVFRIGQAALTGPMAAQDLRVFPNPFNAAASIGYYVEEAGAVRVEVFDLRGKQVCTLVDRFQRSGPWTAIWQGVDNEGKAVASGVYLFVVDTPTQRRTGKMTLLR